MCSNEFHTTFQEYLLSGIPFFLPVKVRVEEDEIYLDVVVNTKKRTFIVEGNFVREVNQPALIPNT